MSTLSRWRMVYTEVSHTLPPQGTVMHHAYWPWYQGHTPRLRQHIRSHVASCGCSIQSSGTHDTPRSSQMDNHSVRASWALSHVTWQSKQRTLHRSHGRFSSMGWNCLLYNRCHTRILRSDVHLCTCRTLDCVEGKDSLLHHLGGCNTHHQLNLTDLIQDVIISVQRWLETVYAMGEKHIIFVARKSS